MDIKILADIKVNIEIPILCNNTKYAKFTTNIIARDYEDLIKHLGWLKDLEKA
jgi:hypothetical protein